MQRNPPDSTALLGAMQQSAQVQAQRGVALVMRPKPIVAQLSKSNICTVAEGGLEVSANAPGSSHVPKALAGRI
jgi:hypothetical protein